MKILQRILFIFIILFLAGCSPSINLSTSNISDSADSRQTIGPDDTAITPTVRPAKTGTATASPSPTPTQDLFTNLYNCEMRLEFTSGPLNAKSTQFTVLGEDYFSDKGDKFKTGKGTGIYYQDQHYFIIHSSYINGNILRPMEAEIFRKYLEYWGSSGNAYIQGQIDNLVGSEVTWSCNDETIFKTRISGIARLSHEASNRLWLEPQDLEQIVVDKEGLLSEWIGEITPTTSPYLYLAFCGWGPESLGSERFTYYRYLLQFEIISE